MSSDGVQLTQYQWNDGDDAVWIIPPEVTVSKQFGTQIGLTVGRDGNVNTVVGGHIAKTYRISRKGTLVEVQA